MKRSLCSWSGGKDSCFALMQAISEGHSAAVLLNVLNEEGRISRSHGIPSHILEAQAAAAGIPIKLISSSWADYEKKFTAALESLKQQYSLSHAVFGDIDLQAHRDWEEKVCAAAALSAVLPLWKKDRRQLVQTMIDSGISCMIVSCNETMGEKFLGRIITMELVKELEKIDVDACGENGEYHTLVLNCPLFSTPLGVKIHSAQQHEGYWFAHTELK
jgi:diphthine-ammonia ligase